MTLYISGPMRGIQQFNFPAFDDAEQRAAAEGWQVINPAVHDRAGGFDPTLSDLAGFDLNTAQQRDVKAIMLLSADDGDAIAMLPNWENSTGARAEKALAEWRGLRVLNAMTLQTLTDEVRVTDPRTGGQKGVKLARFDLIPVGPLTQVAKVFGRGAQKYTDRNAERGYAWGLSFGALQRHLWAFWGGEDSDAEAGLPHLAHACWHCLMLMLFMDRHRVLDDRSRT